MNQSQNNCRVFKREILPSLAQNALKTLKAFTALDCATPCDVTKGTDTSPWQVSLVSVPFQRHGMSNRASVFAGSIKLSIFFLAGGFKQRAQCAIFHIVHIDLKMWAGSLRASLRQLYNVEIVSLS